MTEGNAFCPKCGAKREAEHKFCPECGFNYEGTPPAEVAPPGVTPPYQAPAQYPYPGMPAMQARKNDGTCVAALVLGILAWIVPFAGILFAVLAIIFGAIGIKKVDRSPHTLTGKGMGIAGLILGVSGLVIAIVVVSIAIPVFFAAHDSAQEKTCRSQMRTFLTACDIYAAENEVYPTSMNQLVPNYLEEEPRCPEDNSRYTVEWGDDYDRPEISCPNHGSP